MEASVKATPTTPEGKPPQVLALLRRAIDALLVPVLAVVTALSCASDRHVGRTA